MASIRPSIDSGLSVSRIGSNAQNKLVKVLALGIKNELTALRNEELNTSSTEFYKLQSLNIAFNQNHLAISTLESLIIILLLYRHGHLIQSQHELHMIN